MDELAYLSIAEVGEQLRRRAVSPVEVTRASLQRIERLEPLLNAFITVTGDAAMDEARQAEAEITAGHYRGPLHGVPIAHKDLYWTRGVRTTAGSKVLAEFVPDEDAAVVVKWKQAGTIMLGKLNLHEFAAGGTTDNPHYGPTHNPWKLGYHPGGSSGGSGAALAAGMCYGATGSDTAGSIRIPSHCCGTSGIKPTYGRVSCYGVVPLSWSLDHAGPMARTVEDCALLLQAMAGFDRRDAASVDRPVEDFLKLRDINLGVKGLRVGVPRNHFNVRLQPGVESAWRAAIDTLVQLGAEPVEVEFQNMEQALTIGPTILRGDMRTFHRQWFAERPDDYSPALHERFATVANLSATDYVEAQQARQRIRAELWQAFDVADVLLTPTLPHTAEPIPSLQGEAAREAPPADTTRCTYPFNVSGFPALSVPCGFDDEGLPVGLQIGAAPWQEALALRVGHAYQQATDWHRRRPALEVPAISAS